MQYKSPQLKKKNQNQNKSLKNEWLIFALRNIVSNEFVLIFFHHLMSINYMGTLIETHYQWKVQSSITKNIGDGWEVIV
jgi:hypothetical protein